MLTEYCYAINIVLFDGNFINYSVKKQPDILNLKTTLLLWRLMGLFSVKKKVHLEELGIDDDYTNLVPKGKKKSESLSLWTEANDGFI